MMNCEHSRWMRGHTPQAGALCQVRLLIREWRWLSVNFPEKKECSTWNQKLTRGQQIYWSSPPCKKDMWHVQWRWTNDKCEGRGTTYAAVLIINPSISDKHVLLLIREQWWRRVNLPEKKGCQTRTLHRSTREGNARIIEYAECFCISMWIRFDYPTPQTNQFNLQG